MRQAKSHDVAIDSFVGYQPSRFMTRRHSGKVSGSLNRHVHFHASAIDRVFEEFASDHWTPQKRALAVVGLRCGPVTDSQDCERQHVLEQQSFKIAPISSLPDSKPTLAQVNAQFNLQAASLVIG